MTEIPVSATIVRHIDILEAALRHAGNVMQPLLGKAVGDLLEEKRKSLGWAGEIESELDGLMWLAPPEWRAAGDAGDNYDLYVEFDEFSCVDREETATWIGTFCGFGGAGIRLALGTNAIGPRAWRSLLRTETGIADALHAAGFLCDSKNGILAMTIAIDRERLSQAFADEEFEEALQPIEDALGRIHRARPLLDSLVTAIRKRAAGE